MLLIYTLSFAQERIDPGIPSYVNVNIIPLVGYSKDASNPAIMGGLAVTLSFNNKIFIGAFLENKMNNTKSTLSTYPDYNSKFQEVGLWGGGRVTLGARKTKSGQYTKRKTSFVYSIQLGEGRLRMIGSSDTEASSAFDYFFLVKPMVGLERPIFKNIALCLNAGYFLPIKIDQFYQNTDYSGLAANFGIKFSMFAKKYGSVYIP